MLLQEQHHQLCEAVTSCHHTVFALSLLAHTLNQQLVVCDIVAYFIHIR